MDAIKEPFSVCHKTEGCSAIKSLSAVIRQITLYIIDKECLEPNTDLYFSLPSKFKINPIQREENSFEDILVLKQNYLNSSEKTPMTKFKFQTIFFLFVF